MEKRIAKVGRSYTRGGNPLWNIWKKMQRRVLKSSSFITQVKDRVVDEVWRIDVVDRGD